MRDLLTIFADDIKRVFSNTVTRIIVIGLIIMPSLFAWFNTTACWDVFGNTGKLTVAVASVDEGYKGGVLPIEVNVGNEVINALRANDEINWVFTDEADAIDGAKSGKYYAAVVIPDTFSKDMLTFFSDDVEHAPIVYYSNEKKNAVAPKITDQGADSVSYQVNKTFSETILQVMLNVADRLLDYFDSDTVQLWLGDLAQSIGNVGSNLLVTADVMDTYVPLLASVQTLIDTSEALMLQTQQEVLNIHDALDGTGESIAETIPALEKATDQLIKTLDDTMATYEETAQSVDKAYEEVDALCIQTVKMLRAQAESIDGNIVLMEQVLSDLQTARDKTFDPTVADTLDQLVVNLSAEIELEKQLSANLKSAGDNIETSNALAQDLHANTSVLADESYKAIQEMSDAYYSNLKPSLENLYEQLTIALGGVDDVIARLEEATQTLEGATDELQVQLDASSKDIETASARVRTMATNLTYLSDDLYSALDSKDLDELRTIIGSEPDLLAEALSAPISVERHALYASGSFGSSMSPLYSALALWIGTLLMLVTLKTTVCRETIAKLRKPKDFRLFLGRFLIFALMSTAQALLLALGNMLFLGVDCVHPALYLFCFWICGLAFLFINYALVATFGNVGKAIVVILLIVQVSACGGSFPLELLPDFIQEVSPFMPVTHCVSAMRAAMFGTFHGDFWIEMGSVVVFTLPFFLMGILRKPFVRANAKFVQKVEKSKLI